MKPKALVLRAYFSPSKVQTDKIPRYREPGVDFSCLFFHYVSAIAPCNTGAHPFPLFWLRYKTWSQIPRTHFPAYHGQSQQQRQIRPSASLAYWAPELEGATEPGWILWAPAWSLPWRGGTEASATSSRLFFKRKFYVKCKRNGSRKCR